MESRKRRRRNWYLLENFPEAAMLLGVVGAFSPSGCGNSISSSVWNEEPQLHAFSSLPNGSLWIWLPEKERRLNHSNYKQNKSFRYLVCIPNDLSSLWGQHITARGGRKARVQLRSLYSLIMQVTQHLNASACTLAWWVWNGSLWKLAPCKR